MSDDARAIVAAVLAAASAQTGRPWRELHAGFGVILGELRPRLTPEEREHREAWLANITADTADTAEGGGEPAPEAGTVAERTP
jgi:hypothetical protein